MTGTKKLEPVVPIVAKPATEDEIIPTPAQMMTEDGFAKKKVIYHQPTRKANYAADKARYNEQCGDAYKITLGYPMSWIEYNQLSDSMKIEYIKSIFDKYPGISCNTLSHVFNTSYNITKIEVNRLGIAFPAAANISKQREYSSKIKEIKQMISDGEKPKNLEITRKEDLSKLKRKSYKQIKEMDPEDALRYINGIYNRYDKALSATDFGEMMGASKCSINRLFNAIGFKLASKGLCLTSDSKAIRERFRAEMIEPNQKKFSKRKYVRKPKDENPEVEVVETVIVTEEPAKDASPNIIPMKDIPAVEFYDPITVMEGVIPADRKIEDNDTVEEPVETVTEPATKPEFNITSIDAVVDVDSISEFVKFVGLTGKVKIHIEKI